MQPKIPLTVHNVTALILKHNESKKLLVNDGCSYRPLNPNRNSKQLQPKNTALQSNPGQR